MLSATEPVNRKFSCVTVTIARCRSAGSSSRRSTPSSSTRPAVGSQNRAASRAIVVLPAPVMPTTAIVCPPGISRSRSVSTGRSRYAKSTASKLQRGRAGRERGPGCAGGATARRLLEHARQLLEPGDRGLEQVVELAELLHRLEEPPQVQQERGEHADAHLAVDREPAAVEHDDRGRHPADELHARARNRRRVVATRRWRAR